jgi:uncharacterized protein YegP (UPF0339 family)
VTLVDDATGQWCWILYAKNGKPIAISQKDYERRNDCTTAVKAMCTLFKEGTPRILINQEVQVD